MDTANNKRLFWACWIALIATAFGFIVRATIMSDWGREFGLSETEKGEIFGVGLWPFAISIVLFSLVIDRIGYGRAMVFAFVCHVVSAVVTISAPYVPAGHWLGAAHSNNYWALYVGNFIVALGNGTVEAVINPVVATLFSRDKTKWLNILHAGWPGGLVLGGVLTMIMGETANWQYKVALIFIPVILYAVLMIGCTFPVNERVAAGVSDRVMLQEAGILGAFVVVALMAREVGRVFEWNITVQLAIGLILVIGFGVYTRALGRPMFFFLALIMIPLASTELGTDSWITPLMEGEMGKLGLPAITVLVYTSFIMMILRFCAGPIVHQLSPLGLLAVSSAIAAVGLFSLSYATGFAILAAATLYGVGKTFFWPTMLGVAAEQFPKGGALTLNMLGGIGMLAVGAVGSPFFGFIQDKNVDSQLERDNPALHSKVMDQSKDSVFGEYRPLNSDRVKLLDESNKLEIASIQESAKKGVLRTASLFPVFMLVCYLALLAYFKTKGGYQAEVLGGHGAEDKKFTGGVVGPVEA